MSLAKLIGHFCFKPENLIRLNIVNKLRKQCNSSKCEEMKGLGVETINTLGCIEIECEALGNKMGSVEFKVVNDDAIFDDMVLGIKFMKGQGIIMEMGKWRMSIDK